MFKLQRLTHFPLSSTLSSIYRFKSIKSLLDYSKVPVLNEEDLEERFIKGGGPGGSNVNKTVSCVSLKHLPTGIVMKCQDSRLLHQNRQIAREWLIEKLDEHYNGEFSLKSQRRKLEVEKSKEQIRKAKNLLEKKLKYKEFIGKSSNSNIEIESISSASSGEGDESIQK